MRFLALVLCVEVLTSWTAALSIGHNRGLRTVACVPDFWKQIGRKGHCSTTRDLDTCADLGLEISFSTDCLEFDGNWCCYDPRPLLVDDGRKKQSGNGDSYGVYYNTEPSVTQATPTTVKPTTTPVPETAYSTPAITTPATASPPRRTRYDYSSSGDFGPSNWHKHFPTCNSSGQQSPINIETSGAGTVIDSTDLTFINYETSAASWKIFNRQNTFEFNASFPGGTPQIEGGALPGTYAFLQGHFHWGPDDSHGSEHLINGHQYPLELHLVHVRVPVPNDKRTARTRLAVIGIFYEVSHTPNPELDVLLNHISSVRSANSAKNFTSDSLTMSSFLPDNKEYYRYLGSLTVPPCNEAVVWTVLKTPRTVSSAQLAQLRSLLDENDQPMTINYRPVQPLNNRKTAFHNKDLYLLNF